MGQMMAWFKSGVNLEYGDFDVVSRGEWGARPPIARDVVQLPAAVVVLHFTQTPVCQTRQECVRTIQELQRAHMDDKNHIDIKYNFLVGGDNTIYEGRGWKAAGLRVPLIHEKIKQGETESIDIAFIGTFDEVIKNEEMLNTVENFIKASKLKRYVKVEARELWTEGADKNYWNIKKTSPED